VLSLDITQPPPATSWPELADNLNAYNIAILDALGQLEKVLEKHDA
jgi:hypothetical protein